MGAVTLLINSQYRRDSVITALYLGLTSHHHAIPCSPGEINYWHTREQLLAINDLDWHPLEEWSCVVFMVVITIFSSVLDTRLV